MGKKKREREKSGASVVDKKVQSPCHVLSKGPPAIARGLGRARLNFPGVTATKLELEFIFPFYFF